MAHQTTICRLSSDDTCWPTQTRGAQGHLRRISTLSWASPTLRSPLRSSSRRLTRRRSVAPSRPRGVKLSRARSSKLRLMRETVRPRGLVKTRTGRDQTWHTRARQGSSPTSDRPLRGMPGVSSPARDTLAARSAGCALARTSSTRGRRKLLCAWIKASKQEAAKVSEKE